MKSPGEIGNLGHARIWDLPVRLFHWSLAITLAGSWLTHELGTAWMEWHVRLGYGALTLVTFRLLWGFLGPRYSRFSSFLRGPRAVFEYVKAGFAGQAQEHPGHNPLGGWAILAMLASVSAQGVSGLFQADDFLTEGPWHHAAPEWLRETMHEVHEANFALLATLVLFHLSAVAIYRWRLKSDLIAGMITGMRLVPLNKGIKSDRLWLAILAAVAAALAVWGVIAIAPAPDPGELYF